MFQTNSGFTPITLNYISNPQFQTKLNILIELERILITFDHLVDGVGNGGRRCEGGRKSRVPDVGAVLADRTAGNGNEKKTTNAESETKKFIRYGFYLKNSKDNFGLDNKL